ncbi:HEAT repeat domain-containing protein [Chondromyces apiculatus]|nr:hypothetical protein [Chondromyces apiculatus]
MKQTLTFSALLALVLLGSPVNAAGDVTAPAGPASVTLPSLPRLEPIVPPETDPIALRELDRVLEQLTAPDARSRQGARAALQDLPDNALGAIRLRIQDIRASLDRKAAPIVLGNARAQGRKKLRSAATEDKKGDKSAQKESADLAEDWLEFMLATALPDDATWRDVVKLLAMNRMLGTIGTTPAVREIIAMHAYFGELLRLDLQRLVLRLRDKAVPALIEARKHDAEIVRRWAGRQLENLGRAIPGEAVSTNDTQLLADVLRAYGRTRDVDALRVVLSFCNSERERLREAAREAITAIGEPGIWQLREAYLSMTGNKPPREWGWDRLARELFTAHDRKRLAEVHEFMARGVELSKQEKYDGATASFDNVLSRAPLVDRRSDMEAAFIKQGHALRKSEAPPEQTIAMFIKASALTHRPQQDEQWKSLEAEISYLEGALLAENGTPDRFSFKRALELSPNHTLAHSALTTPGAAVSKADTKTPRNIAIGAISLVPLTLTLVLAEHQRRLRRRQRLMSSALEGSVASEGE